MSRVAIIGCGYVGTALAAELVRRGHDVVGTTTQPQRLEALERAGIRGAVLELAQEDALARLLHDREAVVVMVAPNRPDSQYQEVYLDGVRHLLGAAAGSGLRHIMYTSSTSVYGQTDGSWVDEDAPTQPASANAQILVAAEGELTGGAHRLGIGVSILRVAGIVGPGRGPVNRVRQWAGRERDGGQAYLNLIHRDDIVAACAALLERSGTGTLNLSDGRPIRRQDYYDALLRALGLEPIRWRPPGPREDCGKRVSNRRITALLGFEPRDAARASIEELTAVKI